VRDIPVNLGGYKLTVVEPPAPKMREDANGAQVPVTDRDGATQFTVSLFAKLRVKPGERAPKGEEIKVTLGTDPGPDFGEDVRVELLDARVSPYQIETAGRVNAGLAWRAMSIKHAGPALAPRPSGDK